MAPTFFFNDTATTEIYALSLHDALPIFRPSRSTPRPSAPATARRSPLRFPAARLRSTSRGPSRPARATRATVPTPAPAPTPPPASSSPTPTPTPPPPPPPRPSIQTPHLP